MRSILVGMAAVVAMACGGDDGGNSAPDAAPSNLPACTGAAYDPCEDLHGNTDCDTGLTCRLFMMRGYSACTPSCDASNPCPPDKNGAAVECNGMGRCQAEPNECTP